MDVAEVEVAPKVVPDVPSTRWYPRGEGVMGGQRCRPSPYPRSECWRAWRMEMVWLVLRTSPVCWALMPIGPISLCGPPTAAIVVVGERFNHFRKIGKSSYYVYMDTIVLM